MGKLRKVIGLAAASLITGAAVATLSAAPASALVADEYTTVRQWVCAGTDAKVDLTYTNSYGNTTSVNGTRLDGQVSQDGRVTCIYKDLRAGQYGQYVSTHISNDDGGFVSCAIFVDGEKVSESSDNSEYYSYASCY